MRLDSIGVAGCVSVAELTQRAVCVFLLLCAVACGGKSADEDGWGMKEGDVLFQTSRSAQSRAIQLATHSRWSHVGVVFQEKGSWMVIEAVQPVRFTPLRDWIGRGKGGQVVMKRLKGPWQPLNDTQLDRMRKIGKRYIGRPYDLTFEWDDRRIYCSELVWKIYKEGAGIELSHLQKLKDFDLSHPVVRKKMRERFGNSIPLDEPVVTPQSLFESPLLTMVIQR